MMPPSLMAPSRTNHSCENDVTIFNTNITENKLPQENRDEQRKKLEERPQEHRRNSGESKTSQNIPAQENKEEERKNLEEKIHENRRKSGESITFEKDAPRPEEERAPDGKWGWMIVFGASLILVLADTVGQCFGIIFSRFLLDLETPTVITSWIFNLFGLIWCLMGPPLGPLIKEFGWRKMTFIGSFLLAASLITSAFATVAWVLFFTYSLLAGVGYGIICTISYMIVPHYFNKRRGLANGIIMACDCGGQMLASPIIRILQDKYTFRGATFILGGIVLHCCIGAAVFHPVEWHLKPKTSLEKEDSVLKSVPDEETPLTETSHLQENPQNKSATKIILRLINTTIKDLSSLKSYRGLIIAVGSTFIFNGYLNFLALVPFALQEAGHPLAEASTCVSVSAICNMVTRVFVASLSDNKWFNFHISMLISCLTISGTMVWFTMTENLIIMKMIMGLWGCGVGIFMSLYNLTMVHYMGLDNLISTMGASMLCIAFGYLSIGPLAGYIRDVSQSYAVCIWFLAAFVFMAFLLWLLMPTAVAQDHVHERETIIKKKTKHEEQGEDDYGLLKIT